MIAKQVLFRFRNEGAGKLKPGVRPLMLTISAAEWEGINHRPHHFMRRCAASGWTVLYLEPPASLIAPLKDKRFLKRWKHWLQGMRLCEENLYVLAPPPVLPFGSKYRAVNKFNQWLISRTVKRALRKFPSNRADIYSFLPTAVDLVPLVSHGRVIYDCVDDHTAFTGLINPQVVYGMERELMALADVSFATARQLYEDRQDWSSNFHIIPNGAEYERFACGNGIAVSDSVAAGISVKEAEAAENKAAATGNEAEAAVKEAEAAGNEAEAGVNKSGAAGASIPGDVAGIEHPVAGFVGGISDWVDVCLIGAAAQRMEQVNFVLIGPALTDVSCLEQLPNVKLLGQRPYTSLPAYVRFFDVCLIPFKINKLTESVNPIKLFEYLSAGKPVVSTPLPEVLAYSEVVAIAAGVEETVSAIRKALEPASQSEASQRRRQQVGKENSWDARWQSALELIESCPGP